MPHTFISLLRGINVSGQKKVLMADLHALYQSLGFSQVTTYLQSGNVIFACDSLDQTQITQTIESGISQRFGFTVSVIIRNTNEIDRVVKNNPFLTRLKIDLSRLYVTFLAEFPMEKAVPNLAIPSGNQDEFQLAGKEIYLYCPGGYGVTRLSNNYFEKALKITATTRNWKTVMALQRLAVNR